MIHRLPLQFWGVNVDVEVACRHDATHLAFYFEGHMRLAGDPVIRVVLDTDPPGHGFVSGIGDPGIVKLVAVDHGTGLGVYERFTDRAQRPTPLPPFCLPPFVARFRIHHAACAVTPDGQYAVLIRGASGSGKSTVLLGLLERGWQFMADDIAVAEQRFVHRYHRPIGIRTATMRLFPHLARVREQALAFETATGTTVMARPHDLGYRIGPATARLEKTVTLGAAQHLNITKHSGTLSVSFDPQRHLTEAIDTIAAYVEAG